MIFEAALEVIGQLWVVTAGTVAVYALIATYKDWNSCKAIDDEV